MNRNFPSLNKFHTLVFDFDGVFTDNKVYINQDGKESVACNRSDGLGLDIMRKYIKEKNLDIDIFILSTEKNEVVMSRAKKLKLKCFHGIKDKLFFLKDYIYEKFKNLDSQKGLLYIGNDLNDLKVMEFSGFSVAPSDAHPIIKDNADYILSNKGGDGCVRELIEKLIKLDKETFKQLV